MRSALLKQSIWIICVAAMIGCGPSMGKVTGTVTVAGKPVPGGLVTFRPDDASFNSVSAELDRDGKFSVELPTGPTKICIDNRQYEPQPKAGQGIPSGIMLAPEVLEKIQKKGASKQPEPAPEVDPTESADVPQVVESGRYVRLPEKVFLIETSGLGLEVKQGEQVFDIQL